MLNLVISHIGEADNQVYEKLLVENEEMLFQVQTGEVQYRGSEGWLDTEKWAGEGTLRHLEELAAEIRNRADIFVLIGVGGSNNAARAAVKALQKEGGSRILYAGNTLSAGALKRLLGQLSGKSIYLNCIAKNFETLEPGSSFRVLRQWMKEQYGQQEKERILCTGTKGSAFQRLCQEQGYRFLEFPEDIGGRYTALSNVGLLPMAVAGIDIRSLVRGARDMQFRLHEEKGRENTAYQYACLRNAFYRQGFRVELLSSFEPQFAWFYKWWIQLFAESEGKQDLGLFPAAGEFSEELHAVGQFIQEGTPILFETFLHVLEHQEKLVIQPDDLEDGFSYLDGWDFRDINEAAFQATLKAHGGRLPCILLEIDRIDAFHFGALFYFFQFACAISCKIMGVNPFDQPGVEAYKKWMFDALGK